MASNRRLVFGYILIGLMLRLGPLSKSTSARTRKWNDEMTAALVGVWWSRIQNVESGIWRLDVGVMVGSGNVMRNSVSVVSKRKTLSLSGTGLRTRRLNNISVVHCAGE